MMYEMTVPMFVKGLENLNRVLEKGVQFGESKKIEADVLPNSRLAPDQFNLIRQILVACDTAKLCVGRVTGKDGPKNDDTEKTFAGKFQGRCRTFIYDALAEELFLFSFVFLPGFNSTI